ncbi:MAG: ComF family protein [Dehalococcoidia bacterium]|nr:ComF family protein [Dehalococcoidia bacterium]
MRIGDFTRRVMSTTADALFPSRCVQCNRDGVLLCNGCMEATARLDSKRSCRMCALPTGEATLCGRCSSDPPPVSALVATFAFDGAMRSAIHALKYDGLRAIAPMLGDEMAARWGNSRKMPDAIVPVPLHRSRLRSRGYNQAELLARPVAERIGVPLGTGLLRRVVDSPPQAAATDETERARRVRNVFEADADVEGLHVLLIDDVATTGSTINSAAQALLDAGAWGVSALVLAREL